MTDHTTPVLERGVPIVLAFSHQRIADMVCTAIESPIGDWLIKATTYHNIQMLGRMAAFKGPYYAAGEYWSDPEARLEVIVENPVNDHSGWNKTKTLRMEDFQRALILMATKDDGAYSHHFADFLRSNEDANTADLFMQLAVYGEEVFA